MGASASKQQAELQRKADFGWRDTTLFPLSRYNCAVVSSDTLDFSVAALLRSIPPPASTSHGPLRHQRANADLLFSVPDMDVLNAIMRAWPLPHRVVHGACLTSTQDSNNLGTSPYSVVSHGPVVQHVDVSGHVELGPAHIRRLFGCRNAALLSGPQRLGVAGCLGDTIVSLNFSGTSIGDEGATYLCQLLLPQQAALMSAGSRRPQQPAVCPALQHLILDDCGLTDVGCRAVAAHVLRRNQMAATADATGAPRCRGIRTLSMAHNRLTDGSCSLLADLLGATSSRQDPPSRPDGGCGDSGSGSHGLAYLNLQGNPIGDDGYVMLLLRGVYTRMAAMHLTALGHHDAGAHAPQQAVGDPPHHDGGATGMGAVPQRPCDASDRPYAVAMQSPSPHRAIQSLRRATAASDAGGSPSPRRRGNDLQRSASRPQATRRRGASPSVQDPRNTVGPMRAADADARTPHAEVNRKTRSVEGDQEQGIALNTSCCSLTLASVNAFAEVFGNAHDERVMHAIALLEELQQHLQQLEFALDTVPSSARGAVRTAARKEALVHALRRALRSAQSFPQCTSLSGTRQLRFDALRFLHLANTAMGDDGVELLAGALSRFSASAAGLSEQLADTQRRCRQCLSECGIDSSKPCVVTKCLFDAEEEQGDSDLCFVGPSIFLEEIDLSGVGCTARGVRAFTSAIFGRCGGGACGDHPAAVTSLQRAAGLGMPICVGCTQPFLRSLDMSRNNALGGTHAGNLLAAFTVHAYSAMHHHTQYVCSTATDPFSLGTVRPSIAGGDADGAADHRGRYGLTLSSCGLQDDALATWANRCVRETALLRAGVQAAHAHIRGHMHRKVSCPTGSTSGPSSLLTVDLSNNRCTMVGFLAAREALATIASASTDGSMAVDDADEADAVAAAPLALADCLIGGNVVVSGSAAAGASVAIAPCTADSWLRLNAADSAACIRTSALPSFAADVDAALLSPRSIAIRKPTQKHGVKRDAAEGGSIVVTASSRGLPPLYDDTDVDGLIASSEEVLLRWAM